jgi:hypothetical protein
MALPRVYFFCSNEPGDLYLSEDVIALAEGFVELGIPFFANCNYWLQSTDPSDYLFKHTPNVGPDDCDIVVVNYRWPFWMNRETWSGTIRKPLPQEVLKKRRRFSTVYIDNCDGHQTYSWEEQFRSFDLILRSKLNARAWHPSNMKPWAIGLNKRIMKATAGALPFASRRRVLLVNYGPSPWRTRDLARKHVEPLLGKALPIDYTKDDLSTEPSDAYEALMWRQTDGRFSWKYYDRLKHSQAVACFCGDMIPPMPFRPEQYLVGGNRAKLRRAFFELLGRLDTRLPRAVSWDSFRFWEALSAGCASINVDLSLYGVHLPVTPENGIHYLGVNFARVRDLVDQLHEEPQILARIGIEGKRWAEQHYSPRAAAKRFLELLSYEVAQEPRFHEHTFGAGERTASAK